MSTSSDNEGPSDSMAETKVNPDSSPRKEKGRKRSAATAREDDKAKVPKVEFTAQNRVQLLENLKGQLPKRDTHSYKATIAKIDWEKVAFEPFSPDQCQEQWEIIQADIRKFKNATEIVEEALVMVNNPGYLPKLSALYPNMPKKPLTPFFQYYSEKNKAVKEKNPTFSQTKISQILSEKYKSLPDKKKLKYVTRYAKGMKLYEEMKTVFYKDHPELAHQKKGEKNRAPVVPTPYRLWLNKQLEGKPNVRRSEVETEMRVKWKALTDKRRLKWIHLALEHQTEYENKIADYSKKHESFKPNSKPLLTKAERALYDTQQGKPIRPPMNGYSLFCSHYMKLKNGLTSTQKMQECSKKWKQMSEKERNEYNQKTVQAKQEYYINLEKYVATLPPEEAKKYESELKPSKTAAAKQPKETANSLFTGLEVYISEFKEKFAKKHPELKSNAIEKMLTAKYEALSKVKKDKYEEKAKEMNALSSESEADSSSEEENDDSDDEDEDDDDDDMMARDLWIEHNLHSYMQVHKLKEPRARKSLQLAWENLEKPKKVPWKKQAQQNSNRMQQLLAKMPKKPHTSAYGIYTSEMMRKKEIMELDHKSKMKAVAEKWKIATQTEKKKYQAKKERLWKKYEKDVEKFKESLSSQDQELLEKALANPVAKKVTKSSKAVKQEAAADSSSDEESGSESEEEEASSDESEAEEKPAVTKESDDDEESSSSSESESESEDEADVD